VPPANQISDAFGKRRPLGWCVGGSVESDTCELQGGMTNYRIGPHRTMSDQVCKGEIVISNGKPISAVITFRVNKPPGAQLAHYKLRRHKSSIRPRLSVAYNSQ